MDIAAAIAAPMSIQDFMPKAKKGAGDACLLRTTPPPLDEGWLKATNAEVRRAREAAFAANGGMVLIDFTVFTVGPDKNILLDRQAMPSAFHLRGMASNGDKDTA